MNMTEFTMKYKEFIEIFNAKNLVDDMNKEVAKYTKLLELAKQDYVDTVKRNINYTTWIFSFDKVATWLSMVKNNTIDKRKKYDEKAHYNFINSELRTLLEDDSIEVVDVASGGWESYYYSYVFKTDKDLEHKYYLSIPNSNVLTVDNFHNAYEGKLALYKIDGSCHNMIESSYDRADIKNAYKDLWNKGE